MSTFRHLPLILILLFLTACAPEEPEATQVPIARATATYTAVPPTTSSTQTPVPTSADPSTPTPTPTLIPTQPPTVVPLPLPPLAPFPTVTPDYRYFETKPVFLQISYCCGDGVGYNPPSLIIYGDGQMIISESGIFQEATLTPNEMCDLRQEIEATGFTEPHPEHFTERTGSDGAGNLEVQIENTFYSFYSDDVQFLVEDLANGLEIIQNYRPQEPFSPYIPTYIVLSIEETEPAESETPEVWPSDLPPLTQLWTDPSQNKILIEGQLVNPILELFPYRATVRVFQQEEIFYRIIAAPLLPHETPYQINPYLGLPRDYVPVLECEDDTKIIPSSIPTATPTLTSPAVNLIGQGRIAFVSIPNYYRQSDKEIFISEADGTSRMQLTNNLYDDDEPVFSPDGRYIAFTSDRTGNLDIFVMDSNGRNVIQLTDNPADDASPSWSPDGTKIAFSSYRDGGGPKSDIFVMNADGTEETQLTDQTGIDILPVWSPDGNKIAFVRKLGSSGYRIKILDFETGIVEELASYNVQSVARLSWSPDSLQLVIGSGTATVSSKIHILNLEGNETELFSIASLQRPGSMDWSANGRFIIFSALDPNIGASAIIFDERNPFVYEGSFNLYALDTTTNQIIQITYNQQDELSPSWWP